MEKKGLVELARANLPFFGLSLVWCLEFILIMRRWIALDPNLTFRPCMVVWRKKREKGCAHTGIQSRNMLRLR